MRSSYPGTAGLLFLGAVLLGQPTLARADGQSPSDSVQIVGSRPQPDENLPSDFIDSRPIVAYFDDQVMPDTVRGLLEELKRPDRCGKAAQLRPRDVCALVFYKLDNEHTPDRLRPPFIMKAIYRVSDAENPADTVITMPNSKSTLQRYTDGELYEPLRNIRANICLQDKRRPDQCKETGSNGVLYHPHGILGKIENDREGILPVESARKHFSVNVESPEAADWFKTQQLLELCRLNRVCQ